MKESKRYIIALLLAVISLVVLVGYNEKEQSIQTNVVIEQHEIVSIEGNIIRGELTEGKGEGIYYTKQDFIKLGIDNIKVGDVVEIAWSEDNFNNEEWEEVETLVIVE